jgi:hypothetical protein
MAPISESSTVYLQDFGLPVVWEDVEALGILDRPDSILGEVAISSEYRLWVEASEFEGILAGETLTVDGVSYEVREFRRVDDGFFAHILLTKE